MGDSRIAAVTLKEEGGKVIVTGPYNDMKDVYPKLKSRGFVYNPTDKSWWIDSKKLTPAKLKNVKELVYGKGTPAAPKGHEDPAAEKEARHKAWKSLSDEILKTRLFTFRVSRSSSFFFVLKVMGDTFSVKEIFKAHGARWDSSYWEIDLSTIPEAKVRKLFEELEKVSHSRSVRQSVVEKQIEPKTWKALGANIRLDLNNFILVNPGSNSGVKEIVTRYFEKATYSSGEWIIAPYQVEGDKDSRFYS
jgi:hypothetical protein